MPKRSTLLMRGIEPWMNELFIMNLFIEFGFRPLSLIIIKNLKNNCRNCLVNFNSFKEANNALLTLNNKVIPKSNIILRLKLAKINNNSKFEKNYKNIYVGNLSPNITNQELYNIFKTKYPSVYYATIIKSNGISKGFGFVHFSKEEEYKKSLKEMNGIFIDNRIIRVKEKNSDEHTKKNLFPKNTFTNNKNNYKKQEIFINNEEIDFSEEDEENEEKEEEEKENISAHSESNAFNKNAFIGNIELLKSDNIRVLYNKMQESIDKMFEHYKKIQDKNEISKILLYYTSHYK